ncbi:MAG: putative porin [Ignavibacteriaceae bacterium]
MQKLILLLLLLSPAVLGYYQAADTLLTAPDSSLTDTSKVRHVDTLFSIQQSPWFSASNFIRRDETLFSSYRYSADFFSSFPSAFLRNYGFMGQPNELIIYGAGNNGISYFLNSVPINDPFYNYYDQNYLQSENTDSVEIIPPSRSFLYGTENNLAGLNFLTRDFVPPAPYSRLRYIEGPNDEGAVDFQFNTMLSSKANLFLDISNKKSDDTYSNSASAFWQANLKLKYFFSNNLNISGSYFYNKGTISLNGGVDYDKIASQYSTPDEILYNEYQAPVLYQYRYRKNDQHKIQIKSLLKLSDNSFTELNLYNHKSLDENRQNEHGLSTTQVSQKYDDSYNILGAALKQNFSLSLFHLDLYGFYENREMKSVYFINPSNIPDFSLKENIFGFAGNLNVNISSLGISPSFFAKTVYFRENVYNGFGSDLLLQPFEKGKLYFGISRYERFHSYFLNPTYKPSVISLDAYLDYTDEQFYGKVIFYQRSYDSDFPVTISSATTVLFDNLYTQDFGGGVFLRYNYEFIETDLTLSYYTGKTSTDAKSPVPSLSGNLGVWYRNVHFDSSLVVKAGFSLRYTGEKGHTVSDPFSRMLAVITSKDPVPAAFTIDLHVSGEIKQSAILYFTFENILDNQYYIEPYYPMPRRGIRFGVAWELFN